MDYKGYDEQIRSEIFIEEYDGTYDKTINLNELDWLFISRYYGLTEEFIKEFKDYVIWDEILEYQDLSQSFLELIKKKLCIIKVISFFL